MQFDNHQRWRAVAPFAAVLAAMVCFQLGAALAKGLFPRVGASGATALRLGLSAAVLCAWARPWRSGIRAGSVRLLLIYGAVLGCMNLLFYEALSYIPLGVAVALEFSGPLAVAMLASRRAVDFVWVALAVAGLLALLPLRMATQPLSLVGTAYALGAGVCWALYIVFGRKAGAAHGAHTVTWGTLIAAILIVPVGVWQNGLPLLAASILPLGFVVALLSSAVPYSLEMFALPRLPTQTFGIMMSLDPALAAVAGLVFLGENLTWVQWAAVGCVMAASAGSAATGGAATPRRTDRDALATLPE